MALGKDDLASLHIVLPCYNTANKANKCSCYDVDYVKIFLISVCMVTVGYLCPWKSGFLCLSLTAMQISQQDHAT